MQKIKSHVPALSTNPRANPLPPPFFFVFSKIVAVENKYSVLGLHENKFSGRAFDENK